MAEREKGQRCLRTMYCLAKTSSQALFKQMVLYFASVQWLCAGGIPSQWLRARLEAAAEFYGLRLSSDANFLSVRLVRGIAAITADANHRNVFHSFLGAPSRVPLLGGTPGFN